MSIESEARLNSIREQHRAYFGIVRDIKTAAQLGGEENDFVASIERTINGEKTRDWLLLNPQRLPLINSQVFVDPQITQVGEGFNVTYDIVF